MMALATTTATTAQQESNNNAVDVSNESNINEDVDAKGIINTTSNDNNLEAPSINLSPPSRQQHQHKQLMDFQADGTTLSSSPPSPPPSPPSPSSFQHDNMYITTSTTIDEKQTEADEETFHHQRSSSQADNIYHSPTCNTYLSNRNTSATARDIATTSNDIIPKTRIVMEPIRTNCNYESAATSTSTSTSTSKSTTTTTELTTTKSPNGNTICLSGEENDLDQYEGPQPLTSQQQQQHQTTTNSSSTAPATGESLSNSHGINKQQALPPELQRIFREVAQTGTCAFLPWNTPNTKASAQSGGNAVWAARSSVRTTTTGGAGQWHDPHKKQQHGFKRKHQQQPQEPGSSVAIGYPINGIGALFSSPSLLNGDDDAGKMEVLDRHHHTRRRHHFKSLTLDSSSSSAAGKNEHFDRPNGINPLSTTNEGPCEDNPFESPNKTLGEYSDAVSSGMCRKMPLETDDITDHPPHHPGGQRPSAEFSDYTNSNNNADRKRRRPHHRDADCWNSCSGSMSSVGGGSILSSVRSSSPSSDPLVLAPPPLQHGTLRCAIRKAVELVLDHSYEYQDGYKMSTAEERMFDVQRQQQQQHHTNILPRGNNNGREISDNVSTSNASKGCVAESPTMSSFIETAFNQRKKQLLRMLGESTVDNVSSSLSPNGVNYLPRLSSDGPVAKNKQETRFVSKSGKLFALASGQGASFSSTSGETGRDHHIFTSGSGDTSDASADTSGRRKKKREKMSPSESRGAFNFASGPPFTIQRVAEVLLEPERYYKQTHKLCNALEKLLLVTSPSSAFGGFTGGNTSQNQREEKEIEAWLDEKGRVETEERLLHMNVRVETTPTGKQSPNRNSISQPLSFATSNDAFSSEGSANTHTDSEHRQLTPNPLLHDSIMMGVASGKADDLESTARSSLDLKFESSHMEQSHDGIYSSSVMDGDTTHNSSDYPESLLTENRPSNGRRTDPSLSKVILSEKVTHALQGQKDSVLLSSITQHFGVNRPMTPIGFPPIVGLLNGHHQQPDTASHGHHPAGLETVTGFDGHRMEMEILIDPAGAGSSRTLGSHGGVAGPVIADLEQVEHGRLSASNSDADSDTDVSLDDSASDRSDGSDPSCTGISEPITAARVMALNRMNQQHRREQYLQNRVLGQLNNLPPSDVEYQSGDSIDSLMAEDSGGSDSSSSDFAD